MPKKELGIYVHIPFCAQKCYYCDFVSFANKQEMIKEYINALKKEIFSKSEELKVESEKSKSVGASIECPQFNHKKSIITTIYIGGGTPSFIEAEFIVDIIKTIKEDFTIKEDAEITIEVNPGTVTKEKLEKYKRSGINRISIGLQSANNKLLKEIGRIHTYEEFLNTYNCAREVGFENINVDLMLALPNQTIDDLKDSIEKVVSLEPEHISVYSLILEEGTKLFDLVTNKKIKLLDDNVERIMYWRVKEKLEQVGYIHYEISNFAKNGYESKHNLNCWSQEEYIGVGLAAHSYVDGVRYSNTENMNEYINAFSLEENGKNIVTIHEKQNIEEKQKEYMMLGLRKLEGVKISDFKNKFVR